MSERDLPGRDASHRALPPADLPTWEVSSPHPPARECCLEADLRRDLVHFSRWLSQLGFVPGTSGNLSVRLDEHRLLATPTGMSKYLLTPDDLVTVDLSGRILAGARPVTSEISMHLAVYRMRPTVQAVIHSHPPIATAFACAGRALDDSLCQEAIMTLGTVPLARYATTGTHEVAASLSPFIPDHDAILLANHGAISYGTSLLDAFFKTETLEHLAQVSLVAHQLGSAKPMSAQQIADLHIARARYQSNSLAAPAVEPSTSSDRKLVSAPVSHLHTAADRPAAQRSHVVALP